MFFVLVFVDHFRLRFISALLFVLLLLTSILLSSFALLLFLSSCSFLLIILICLPYCFHFIIVIFKRKYSFSIRDLLFYFIFFPLCSFIHFSSISLSYLCLKKGRDLASLCAVSGSWCLYARPFLPCFLI